MRIIAIPALFFLIIFSLTYRASADYTDKKIVTANSLDMSNLENVDDKKQRFFNFMRPIINAENAKILSLREILITARNNKSNPVFIRKVADNYSVDWQMDADKGEYNWEKLLERVDAVALEVVLAQSANESAWGQSRFARQGNNFFGQWCYEKGCGMVPKNHDAGPHHEVTAFTSVNASVRSYLKNINTGRVYDRLRKVRRQHREQGEMANAHEQAGGLIRYSQRRGAYVKEIRSIIVANKQLMLGANN